MRLTERQRADRALTEAQFLSLVIDLAHLLRWKVAHFRPAFTGRGWRTPVQGDGAGFPDLVMVRGDRLIAAELKREVGGHLTAEQDAWLADFAGTGAEVFVWRPSDVDVIAETLA